MSLSQCSLFLTTTLLLIIPTCLISASNIFGLFVNGQRSHLLIYMTIARLLLEKGHNVTVVTTLNLDSTLAPSHYNNLRHIQLSQNYTLDEVGTVTGTFQRVDLICERIKYMSGFLNDTVWKSFMQEKNEFDLMLLGYLFNDYQMGVAAHFNCPIILIWTGQPVSIVHNIIGNPEERAYVSQPYDRHQHTGLNNLAFGIFENIVDLIALDVMQKIYDAHFPKTKYPSFSTLRNNVSLVLCNHHSLSEGPIAPYVPGIIEIGGIQNSYKQEMRSEHFNKIINGDFIYLSFGSRIKWSTFPPNITTVFLSAFEKLNNYTILWTYDNDCSNLPKTAINVICNEWWSQRSLLSHPNIKLFITHGGKGSISEAKYNGVAMLCLPFFGDQNANCGKIVREGFGLNLNIRTITTPQLVAVIEQLIENQTFSNNIKEFSKRYRDRPMTANETVVYWIDYVIRHNGALHLRSPLLELNIFQYYLVDVYIFIMFIFFIIVIIINWLERKLNGAEEYIESSVAKKQKFKNRKNKEKCAHIERKCLP